MAKWCVRHHDGWCAVADNAKPKEDVTSVPTKCGQFVILPLGTSKREPTCPECLAARVALSGEKGNG